MAENLSVKNAPVDSILECPLCLHQLTLPQTLQQCLHSFCKSCLDKVPQKTQDGCQGWLCPMCENFTKCDQIQQDTFIEELQTIHLEPEHGDKIKCEQCSDDCGPAAWKCSQCKIGMCDNGKAVHLRIPMLKGHQIVPLDSDGEKLIDNIVFCKLHEDIPVQMNCHDCEELICYMCKISDHNAHETETIDEALKRLLPLISDNEQKMGSKLDCFTAQLDAVSSYIDSTRERYATCRMSMDDHLEKVIGRLHAMKAKMEENVNDQETVALDTLNTIKKTIENQMSQTEILTNLTTVCTSKSMHTSLLHKLQDGLFEKVKINGKAAVKDIQFEKPEPELQESDSLEVDLMNIYGNLCYKLQKGRICTSGEASEITEQKVCILALDDVPSHFMHTNFSEFSRLQFQKDREIDVHAGWCNRLSFIDRQIWLPLDNIKAINVYTQDGELDKVIKTGEKTISVVRKAHNGDIICAGDSGLFVTNQELSEFTILKEGKFSDIVVHENKVSALDYENGSVHTLCTIFKAQHGWRECNFFSITRLVNDCQIKLSYNSTISVTKDYKFVIAGMCQNIAMFSYTGKSSFVEKLDICPAVCQVDANGRFLIVNSLNCDLFTLNPSLNGRFTLEKTLHTIPRSKSLYVIADGENNVWILSVAKAGPYKDLYKLTKYKPYVAVQKLAQP